MAEYRVTHKTFGNGIAQIDGDYVKVKFSNETKSFLLKGFDKYFSVQDQDLLKLIREADAKAAAKEAAAKPVVVAPQVPQTKSVSTVSTQKAVVPNRTYGTSSNALLGPRSQTIHVSSMGEMFEIVGYMARPGRVGSFEAEVPKDGRDDVFERMFPGQTYRPIELGNTPSGMPNKLSPQFRINFLSTRNCPATLKSNMGAGNGVCVARINKSRFVIDLVENYGFRFGDRQDVAAIRKIAEERGYLEDFERGYSL